VCSSDLTLSTSPGTIGTESFTTIAHYPSNANTFIEPRALFNGNIGIQVIKGANGNRFIGGSSERNVVYNIEDSSTSYQANVFSGVWTEGNCTAHAYVNHPAPGSITVFEKWPHAASGGSSSPDRALVVNSGNVIIRGATGTAVSYPTVAGSNAPFRLTKPNGLIYITDCTGSTISGNGWIEDSTGAKTGLYFYSKQNNWGTIYGPQVLYNDNTSADGFELRTDTLITYPWMQAQASAKALLFGVGAAAPDAGVERKAANVLGMLAGDSFQVGGITGETLKYNAGTANAAVACTFSGAIGPTGATAGNQLGWLRINVAGTDRFVPYW
jgi:hypothetical protein